MNKYAHNKYALIMIKVVIFTAVTTLWPLGDTGLHWRSRSPQESLWMSCYEHIKTKLWYKLQSELLLLGIIINTFCHEKSEIIEESNALPV